MNINIDHAKLVLSMENAGNMMPCLAVLNDVFEEAVRLNPEFIGDDDWTESIRTDLKFITEGPKKLDFFEMPALVVVDRVLHIWNMVCKNARANISTYGPFVVAFNTFLNTFAVRIKEWVPVEDKQMYYAYLELMENGSVPYRLYDMAARECRQAVLEKER